MSEEYTSRPTPPPEAKSAKMASVASIGSAFVAWIKHAIAEIIVVLKDFIGGNVSDIKQEIAARDKRFDAIDAALREIKDLLATEPPPQEPAGAVVHHGEPVERK